MNADKEKHIRSKIELVQTIGKAASNIKGRVILCTDKITKSMKDACGKTQMKRSIQNEYNSLHNITPKFIAKTEIVHVEP